MSDGMTCYERDETLCEDPMCPRVGCRIRNDRLSRSSTGLGELREKIARAIHGRRYQLNAKDTDSMFAWYAENPHGTDKLRMAVYSAYKDADAAVGVLDNAQRPVARGAPGIEAWTPAGYWEYVGGLAGEFEADQMRDMLAQRGLQIVGISDSAYGQTDCGAPTAWMNSGHIEAYQSGKSDGIAWASPIESEFYDVALYAAPRPLYTVQEPADWQEMPQTRRLLSTINQGVECTFDDSQVTIFISDESDPSVGLDGGLHLSLSCNYEVIPISLLRDIKSSMGDNWERCVASWQEAYASSVSSTPLCTPSEGNSHG